MYSKISALDQTIEMHHFAIESDRRLVKQAPKHVHADLATEVEVEVDKLENAGFIWKYNT